MLEMESQTQPSKIACLADYSILGIGQTSCLNMERHGSSGGSAGSPPIGLGLALGRGGSTDRRPIPIPGCTLSYGFTILQLQELQLQSLIYKYIESGFPVPYHLVLPIWKSVSSSLSGFNSSLYQLYPTFMGYSIPLHLEYKNGMDPEPGRCRRTDGKKWRCSKEALPDQKYCERHMHRGRQRSRKLVEAASQNNSASTNLSISLPFSNDPSNGEVGLRP
ncbi:growth-regulating factor 10 isoform X1 [Hevea brasiliensis]|uniref:growth-regulating factor 10 isoform X1 n=1 Tax=Hevea brasiliensis TaxID=3981 RepID=UPI000B771123|nr:growth-regulating factor 10 isoform X1 [Hevea brasiliensis]